MQPYTPAELVKASDHLAYEIAMVIRYSRALQEMPTTVASNETYRRAYTESFLLHLIHLVDFFYSDPGKDEIRALHYVDDFKRLSLPDGKRQLLEQCKVRARRQLAHMSHWRTESPAPADWDVGEIMNNNLLAVMQDFIQRVPRHLIGSELYGLRNTIFGFSVAPGGQGQNDVRQLSTAAIFLAVDPSTRK